MGLVEVHELVDHVGGFDGAGASLEESRAALADVTRLAGWLESRRLAVVARISALSSFPEKHVAEGSRTSQRAATRSTKRAEMVGRCKPLADALAAGDVTGEHVDAARRALNHVAPDKRDAFAGTLASLVPVAAHGTPEQFELALRRAIESEDRVDGEDRLIRQRAAARLRTWTDRHTGMCRFSGEFDPESGLGMNGRLDRKVVAMFADRVPDGCPTDPEAKQDWLRAQAFIALVNGDSAHGAGGGAGAAAGAGAGAGAPEMVVVVDTRDGTVRWDLDVDLPASAVQRFIDRSRVFFVDVHGTVINFADGRLNLGRTSRLANRAQRRAKQAIHATCAVPGCNVRFANTKLHHIVWWEHGGLTDLTNLAPLCVRHHGLVHTGKLELVVDDSGNVLAVVENTMATGPPSATAA
jgi:hypothetical protein